MYIIVSAIYSEFLLNKYIHSAAFTSLRPTIMTAVIYSALVNLSDTVKLRDESPLLDARFLAVSLTQTKLYIIVCHNSQIFVTVPTRVGVWQCSRKCVQRKK